MKKTVIIIIIIIERVLLKRREVEKLQEHCTSVNVTKTGAAQIQYRWVR